MADLELRSVGPIPYLAAAAAAATAAAAALKNWRLGTWVGDGLTAPSPRCIEGGEKLAEWKEWTLEGAGDPAGLKLAEGFIRFSFCLRLQNQTRTTSFSIHRLSEIYCISSEVGLGLALKARSRFSLTVVSIEVRFFRRRETASLPINPRLVGVPKPPMPPIPGGPPTPDPGDTRLLEFE